MKFELFDPIAISEFGQRDRQEDTIFPKTDIISNQDRLFLVCDGMGGHSKGDVASSTVCNTVSQWIKDNIDDNGVVDDDIVREAIERAHMELDKLDDGSVKKMGTTLTLVCLHNGGITMGHIGDSRIYHIRPSERKILYKTIDHSLVYDQFRSGEISYDEMSTSTRRNVITRALMPGQDNNVEIDITHTTDIQPDDIFFMCTDGILEQMNDQQLVEFLCSEGSDTKKASLLKSLTMDNKDNHSAIMIRIKQVLSEVGDKSLPNDEANSHYNEVTLLANMGGAYTSSPEVDVDVEAEVIEPEPPVRSFEPQVRVEQDYPSYEPPIKKSGNNLLKLIIPIVMAAAVIGVLLYLFLGNNDKKDEKQSTPAAVVEQPATTEDIDDYHAPDARQADRPASQSQPSATNHPSTPEKQAKPASNKQGGSKDPVNSVVKSVTKEDKNPNVKDLIEQQQGGNKGGSNNGSTKNNDPSKSKPETDNPETYRDA